MTNITKLLRDGTPETLFTNGLEQAEQYEVALVVVLTKDNRVGTEWSKTTAVTALGLIEMLRNAIIKEL